jgi:uncharacterized protein YkwD
MSPQDSALHRASKVLAFASAALLCAAIPAAVHVASVARHRSPWALAPAADSGRIRNGSNAAIGEAIRPNGAGYWVGYPNGTVETAAPAPNYGDLSSRHLSKPIEATVGSPDGEGFWLVASDGGVFGFGDARFYGSTGNVRLAQPVVGMTPTPDGKGYWLVASDGGIFAYGDARFHGSGAGVLPQEGEQAVGIEGAGQGGYWIETSSGTPLAMDAPMSAQSPAPPPASASAQASRLAASQDPSQSVAPSSAFESSCFGSSYSPSSCDQAALADINSARAEEGYGPLSLPSNYSSLGIRAQIVAAANAERTSRGLPALPEDQNLDAMAQNGARAGTDPTGPSGYSWASNWAEGYPTSLSADYAWMYDDGTNSPNIDCTSTNRSGCWGHRRNILSPWGGRSGAGASYNSGTSNLTQLFAESYP